MIPLCDESVELIPEDPLTDTHEAGADVYLSDVCLLGIAFRHLDNIRSDTLHGCVYTEADAAVEAYVAERVVYILEERVEPDADPVLHDPVAE